MKKIDFEKPSMFGSYLSLACAIHCAAEPIVLPLLPLAGAALPVNSTLELWMIGASISLALVNFSRGFKAHGRSGLFALLAAALALIGAGVLAGHLENIHGWEAGLVAAGSAVLAAGQFWNRKLYRHCAHCARANGLAKNGKGDRCLN